MIMWVIFNLKFDLEKDTLWLAYNSFMEQDLAKLIKKELPKLKVKEVILHTQTRGAAETLFSVTQHFDNQDLEKRTISLDCDAIYYYDILGEFRKLPANKGCCFYFNDSGEKAIYSYVELNYLGLITNVKEKVKISDNANTGAYGFPDGKSLKNYCAKILDKGVVGGEYYTSNIVSQMLSDNVDFFGINVPINDYFCVGTPAQLQSFLEKIKSGVVKVEQTVRFCFDLDNTLVTFPQVAGDYSTCEPRQENINLVKDLYKSGHTIIIQTARRMKTHKGNVGAILADIGRITFNQLDKFDIPYHEIHFGKPHADVYVDDLAVNALIDTAKEIGWASNAEGTCKKQHKELVDHRSFNDVVRMGDVIVKTTDLQIGKGEAFFYENIPENLEHLFPKLIKVDRLQDNRQISITMSHIKSTSFAQLNCIGCITPGRLNKLLDALKLIHRSKNKKHSYHNYTNKLEDRFKRNIGIYKELEGSEKIYDMLFEKLKEYQNSNRQLLTDFIHGDPVFSNVLLTPDGNIKLIDMRGQHDGQLTMSGDSLYDMAKVYQSLLGYDIVLLLNRYPTDQEQQILSELKNVFKKESMSMKDIELITMSHLFTLIPLHNSNLVRKWAYSIVSTYLTSTTS